MSDPEPNQQSAYYFNDLTFVDSTGSHRTVNNVMRHEYRILTDTEKQMMKHVKDMGLNFHEAMNLVGSSRELDLAKMKIEEAVFWAVKHITK